MAEVQVIQASDGPIVRDVRMVGKPVQLTRKRVAAYVRVSTDGEEQLQSFQSQKQYYQDKSDQRISFHRRDSFKNYQLYYPSIR